MHEPMKNRLAPATRLLCAAIIATSCTGSEPEAQPDSDVPGPAGGTVHEFAYLEDDVQHLLEFLRGNEALREALLADSVTLYVAPEGGGAERKVAAAELRDPAAWRVGPHSLVPPAGLTDLRVTPGLHSHCEAVPLDTRFPELARHPHVGVRLASDAAASCLQTWNVTFVFSDDAVAPRLTGVAYDQWEW